MNDAVTILVEASCKAWRQLHKCSPTSHLVEELSEALSNYLWNSHEGSQLAESMGLFGLSGQDTIGIPKGGISMPEVTTIVLDRFVVELLCTAEESDDLHRETLRRLDLSKFYPRLKADLQRALNSAKMFDIQPRIKR